MKIYDISVNYLKEPLGIDEPPEISWKIESAESGVIQKCYEIKLYTEQKLVWDSGRQLSDQSTFVPCDTLLEARTRYEVEVYVQDNYGNENRAKTYFETGLMSEEAFEGDWITTSNEPAAARVFSKNIVTDSDKSIKKARLYATALGVYEAAINGVKVGDAFFAPGWTSYKNRILYQTYDITDLLLNRDNSLEINVGNGWYAGFLNGAGEHHLYGEKTAVKAMVIVTYEDGSEERIATDSSWQIRESYIRSSELYMGELQELSYNSKEVSNAVVLDKLDEPKTIVAQPHEPIRITKVIDPIEKMISPKGELIVDFGQNLAGFVEVKLPPVSQLINQAEGIRIYHCEALDKDGNFFNETYRTAKSEDCYIYDESFVGKVVRPHFTYHGFRYIKVEGLKADTDISIFKADALHSDMKEIGDIRTSNEKINQLISNIKWGQRSNFFDVPTDCPQRDERLGWTGDAQIFSRTGMTNFHAGAFFRKWMKDVALESDDKSGVPQICPNVVSGSMGTSIWSDCATVIPWNAYLMYGDKKILKDQYANMKLWVDWIYGCCGEDVLWMNGFQRGDWLALDGDESLHLMSGGTDKNLIANIYYAYSTRIVRDTAELLGEEKDCAKYDDRLKKLCYAIKEEYITSTGRLVTETQTACTLMLYFDLVEGEQKKRIVESLEQNFKLHKNKLTTGFVGTAFVCHVLSENGLHDLAAEILLNEDYPGWLYAINRGATTIWERWNSILPDGSFEASGMNSLNHYTYGAIGDWLYRKVGGINPLEAGYKKILIKPCLTRGLLETDTSLDTMYGVIRMQTKCDEGMIRVGVDIPANTTAVIRLPEKEEEINVGSGHYEYAYETDTVLKIGKYHMNMTFSELADSDDARVIVNEAVQGMLDGPMASYILGQTPNKMLEYDDSQKEKFEVMIKRLNM